MHLVSTTVGFSSTLNPRSCLFRVTLQDQPPGAIAPQPDGSCEAGQPSLHEVDTVTFSGTLSF